MHSIRNPEQFRKNIRSKLNEKLFNGVTSNLLIPHSPKCNEDDLSINHRSSTIQRISKSVTNENVQTSDLSERIEDKDPILHIETKEILDLIATNLEKGIFNYSIKEANKRMIIKKWENTKFTQLYIDRLRTIYLNLNNSAFIERIVTMQIKPEEYAEITHQDIFPGKWKCLIEQNNKKEESLLSVNIKANTDLYTCRKCKSRNIYFTETQTRSADEQSTITLLCLTCGKRWTHG